MDDKTLLEMAARAANLKPEEAMWHPRAGFVWVKKVDGIRTENAFNSLRENGDAMSLSVALHINIEHGQYSVRAYTDDAAPVMVDETVFTPDESQRQFAMREAITRAAAAIGSAHEALQSGDRG